MIAFQHLMGASIIEQVIEGSPVVMKLSFYCELTIGWQSAERANWRSKRLLSLLLFISGNKTKDAS